MAKESSQTLKGRVALVTGAGSGIGKAAALRLARAGAKVGALDLKIEELNELMDEAKQANLDIVPLATNVGNADEVRVAVQKMIDTCDRLDIAFANAGINGVWAPLEELTPEDWDTTIDTNL